MNIEILSPQEASVRLQQLIYQGTPSKAEVLSLCKWIQIWNENLSEDNKVICYIREGINISFTTKSNIDKNNRPNFLIIKNTDIDY